MDSTKKVKVLLVDDHPLFRKSLGLLLQGNPNVEGVEEAGNGYDCIRLLRTHPFDVVLLDIQMPVMDGFAAMEVIQREFPTLCVIVLTQFSQVEFIKRMFSLGVQGYLMKTLDEVALMEAFDEIALQGKPMQSHALTNARISDLEPGEQPLTEIERQIIKLICAQYTSEQIAEEMNFSKSNVDYHRGKLLKKAKVENTAGLIRWAFLYGYH